MKIIVRDESPCKTIVMSIKLYRIIQKCFRGMSEKYKLKGIALYIGTHGEEDLDKEVEQIDG